MGVCVTVTVVKVVDGPWFSAAAPIPMGGKMMLLVEFVLVFEKYWCAEDTSVNGKSLIIGSDRVSPDTEL